MYTPQENYQIKQTARDMIHGKFWSIWQLLLIHTAIYIVATYINEKVFGINLTQWAMYGESIPKELNLTNISFFYIFQWLIILVQIPMLYGILHNILLLIRGVRVENPYSLMFEKYKTSKDFGKTMGAVLLSYLIMFLYSLLFIIPGIIKQLSYSLIPFILYDEPELTVKETLKKSEDMMNGYKGKLFLLMLSFIGWIILSAITFGLLYIWLAPYMMATMAKFYDEIRRSYYNDDPAKNPDKVEDNFNTANTDNTVF